MSHLRRWHCVLVTVIVGWTMNSAQAAETNSPAESLLHSGWPLVIAHRGYCQIAPENSLPAFRLAKTAGADLVELDYHHSKDGKLVVIHDATLDRTTDATNKWGGSKIRVDSKTLGELQSLDAGKWFGAQFAGTRLPSLHEALEVIQDGGMTLIERKAGDAATCVKLLQEQDLVNKVIVQAFDWDYLTDFHQREPRQVLGALGPPSIRAAKKLTDDEKLLSKAWITEAQKTGARVIVWNKQVTRETVTYAQQQGLKVWVYTINDPAEAERLLDFGVDGLITNNTSLIWRTIALRKSAVK
jgi:glycerophosphoryl diester phosphodiesterase